MMRVMRRRPPRVASALALIAAGAIAIFAIAGTSSSQAQKKRPTLHQPLPAQAGDTDASPVLGKAAGDNNPAAIAAGDKVLPAPPLADKPAGEPVLGTGDFGADRSTESPPDRSTASDGTLRYASVFNPDVLPFKRMSALDGVRDDYTLVIERRGQTEVPVGGTTDKSRDRFWGSMPIRITPGVEIPLPSVAPDMRILSYETQPKVRLTFSKDGADNFYVRSDDSGSAGTYRLVFLADADAGYFAPKLPDDRRYTAASVSAAAPPELKPRLPPRVRSVAESLLRDTLVISSRDDLRVAFNKLVEYFRGFEAKDPPSDSGDIYRDLCIAKAGVCRHRAFAFMITANTLGIPTRFVSNEAHAFVEVWFPGRNWQRVDLGGAALRLEVSGGEDKTLHRPRSEDPFNKPREYSENYTQLEGDISGLSQSQINERRRPTGDAPASGDVDGAGMTSGAGQSGQSGLAGSPSDPFNLPGRITPNRDLPVATPDPKKPTPVLTVTRADSVAYRGGTLHIEGSAIADGKPLAGRPIDVYISRAGSRGVGSKLLRRVITAPNGTFSDDFDIPADVKLAPHEIHIASPEDAEYNGALSQ
jgi:transglutaminase-like putative cysteine protease